MKTQPDKSVTNLKPRTKYTKKKRQNENHSEVTPMLPDDVLTDGCKEAEGEPKDKSTPRALELSHKGIFACPKYNDLFITEDDVRME